MVTFPTQIKKKKPIDSHILLAETKYQVACFVIIIFNLKSLQYTE